MVENSTNGTFITPTQGQPNTGMGNYTMRMQNKHSLLRTQQPSLIVLIKSLQRRLRKSSNNPSSHLHFYFTWQKQASSQCPSQSLCVDNFARNYSGLKWFKTMGDELSSKQDNISYTIVLMHVIYNVCTPVMNGFSAHDRVILVFISRVAKQRGK